MNPNELGQFLFKNYPDLEPVFPLKLIGAGFSSWVWETASGYVVRLARQSDMNFASEVSLLEKLASELPITIPQPTYYHARTENAPTELLIYPKLSGYTLDETRLATLDQQKLAHQLAELMVILHQLPPRNILPENSANVTYADLVSTAMPALQKDLTTREYKALENWRAEWRALIPPAEQVLIHGDLWYGNLLLDEAGNISGILDWEACQSGDPVRDFAPQYYLGNDFVQHLTTAYENLGGKLPTDYIERVNHYRILREFEGLAYAINYDDAEEYADALAKIRNLESAGYPLARFFV